MLFGPVASESVASDLKFTRSIAEAHEAKHPEKETDSFGADILDCADLWLSV